MWRDSLSSSFRIDWVSEVGSFPGQPNSMCFLGVIQPVLQAKNAGRGHKTGAIWSSGHLNLLGQAGDLPKAKPEWQEH